VICTSSGVSSWVVGRIMGIPLSGRSEVRSQKSEVRSL
jgi:hypothetical protein